MLFMLCYKSIKNVEREFCYICLATLDESYVHIMLCTFE